MKIFGLAIFGIPGAGKTTLTNSICELFNEIGRPFKVVNLDPASDIEADFSFSDIISVTDVEDKLLIGPNGAINLCFEFLLKNLFILENFIEQNPRFFYIFDMPGEVESIISNNCVRDLLSNLMVDLAVAFLIDSAQLETVSRFTAIFLETAAVEASLEFPFISVLTKTDLVTTEIDEYLSSEPDNILQEFVQNNQVISLRICCLDVENVKMLINEVDSRVEYFRGSLGEYKELEREEIEEIEAFMDAEEDR